MKRTASVLILAFLAAGARPLGAGPAVAAATNGASEVFSQAAILAVMKNAADWQLQHRATERQRAGERAWTYGAFYAGIMALSGIADTPKYEQAMLAMGKKQDWRPGPRRYHADDHCVCQTYLQLYGKHRDPAMLKPTQAAFDYILAHPATNGLLFTSAKADNRWSWCDALFMAPPAWTYLAEAAGDRRYLEFMKKEWRATSDYLYDTSERLYFRDSSYFEKREANGRKVFWSRGNGWVMAGLARVLERLPADDPDRPWFEQQYRQMAARIASLQQPDGLWRSSLLDPASYPLKETSGSGFFTFALAWGINRGLLDRGTFEPVVRRAWKGLVECVTAEGKLEHVQPIGADPKRFDPASTELYGTGAFLLAGSEMHRLISPPSPAQTN